MTPPDPGATYWLDPSSWSQGSTNPNDVPAAGASFEIGAESVIIMNTSPVVGNVECSGTVIIPNDMDVTLDYHSWMWMPGSRLIFADGTPGNYTRKFTARPRGAITGSTPRMVAATTGATPVQMGQNNSGSDRSMMFEDTAEVLGGPPVLDHHWRLADHATIGTNFIKVRGTAVVKQGDKFVIGTTDYYGQSPSETMTVAADSTGDTITFTTNFANFHWGKLQWVTKTADRTGHMSLVDEGWRPANDAPYTFDESAHVMRLNRSIRVDGSMDGALGGRIMVHGRAGRMEFDGWEFAYMGVIGLQQWYGGVHHHMGSYVMPDGPNSPSNGSYVGGSLAASLASGHFVRNCSVHHSKNRGHVPHGTNGITYDHNVYFDIVSSSLFIEEGSAQLLVINENHSLLNRLSTAPNILQLFDADTDFLAAAAAFWLTNPNNTVTNNSAGDCYTGFWNAYTNRNPDMPAGYGCFGLSKNIPIAPGTMDILTWDNNESYSFFRKGTLTDNQQSNEAGNVSSQTYPLLGSAADGHAQKLNRPKFWKGFSGGYQNRVREVQYINASAADVCGTVFNGATTPPSFAPNGLAICQSLNVTTRPTGAPVYDSVANSYHGSLVFPGWIAIGFSANGVGNDGEANTNGEGLLTSRGFFRMWSEYLNAATYWFKHSRGIELLNSHLGFNTPPMHLEQEAPYTYRALRDDRHGDLSGAKLMYDDYLGAGTTGKFWIFPVPFATYGAANLQEVTPTGQNYGYTTSSKMYGLFASPEGADTSTNDGLVDATYDLDWRRLNPADLTQEVGHWFDPKNKTTGPVNGVGFRHCAAMSGGVYKINLPSAPQVYMQFRVEGSRVGGDPFVLITPYTGAKTAQVCTSTQDNDIKPNHQRYISDYNVSTGTGRKYTAAASIADLVSGAANRFYQDKPNNLVYLKYDGGHTADNLAAYPDSESYDFWSTAIMISSASDYP